MEKAAFYLISKMMIFILLNKEILTFSNDAFVQQYVAAQTEYKKNTCCHLNSGENNFEMCCQMDPNKPCCSPKNLEENQKKSFFNDVENVKNKLLNMNLAIDTSNTFFGVIDADGNIEERTKDNFHIRGPLPKNMGSVTRRKKKYNIVVHKPVGRILEVKSVESRKQDIILEKSHLNWKIKSKRYRNQTKSTHGIKQNSKSNVFGDLNLFNNLKNKLNLRRLFYLNPIQKN